MLLITRILALVGATTLLALTGLTFVDVIGRYFFSRPVTAASEVIALLLGLTIFAAMPAVTQKEGHISVEILQGILTARQNRVRGVIVRLLTIFGLGVMSYVLYRQAARLESMYMATPHLRLRYAPYVYSMAAAMGISTAVYAVASARHIWTVFAPKGRS